MRRNAILRIDVSGVHVPIVAHEQIEAGSHQLERLNPRIGQVAMNAGRNAGPDGAKRRHPSDSRPFEQTNEDERSYQVELHVARYIPRRHDALLVNGM